MSTHHTQGLCCEPDKDPCLMNDKVFFSLSLKECILVLLNSCGGNVVLTTHSLMTAAKERQCMILKKTWYSQPIHSWQDTRIEQRNNCTKVLYLQECTWRVSYRKWGTLKPTADWKPYTNIGDIHESCNFGAVRPESLLPVLFVTATTLRRIPGKSRIVGLSWAHKVSFSGLMICPPHFWRECFISEGISIQQHIYFWK